MNQQKTNLKEAFISYIKENSLFERDDEIILAVSGGVDSVVLTNLMAEEGYNFKIAHCNFDLRGEESIRDEKFTRDLAYKYGVEFFVTQFNTYDFAFKRGISIEMAARELRYKWFKELAKEHKIKAIVTGHHLDDQIETFFINVARGTGISGLRGMLPKAGDIIRPLLFAFRSRIEEYAIENNLEYIHDSSNDSEEFQRNKIRHKVIPLFEEINPGFKEVIARTMNTMRETERIYDNVVSCNLEKVVSTANNEIRIDIISLKKLEPLRSYLFEILNPFGFNYYALEEILRHLDGESGKVFLSQTHRLIKDREHLIITDIPHKQDKTDWHYLINTDDKAIDKPIGLKFRYFKRTIRFKIPHNKMIACFDAEKLIFPLTIRRWFEGDAFRPLGMKQRKKLSDLFTDLKLSIVDKEQIWLLVNGNGEIIWVVGHRIDDRYKINPETSKICEITLANN